MLAAVIRRAFGAEVQTRILQFRSYSRPHVNLAGNRRADKRRPVFLESFDNGSHPGEKRINPGRLAIKKRGDGLLLPDSSPQKPQKRIFTFIIHSFQPVRVPRFWPGRRTGLFCHWLR
jgi:hypothetical protein